MRLLDHGFNFQHGLALPADVLRVASFCDLARMQGLWVAIQEQKEEGAARSEWLWRLQRVIERNLMIILSGGFLNYRVAALSPAL